MATSHKRDTNARRTPSAALVATSVALLVTSGAIAVGVATTSPSVRLLPAVAVEDHLVDTTAVRGSLPVTRSQSRTVASQASAPSSKRMSADATLHAIQAAHVKRWTTTDLNLWTRPGHQADQVGELTAGKAVLVTGRRADGRTEVVVNDRARWVTDGYLSADKPPGVGAGLSMAPCPDGSVERGLTANAVFVYRSVCHAFPQITTYGGWDAHGEHASGKALDIMTSDVTLGTAIADFLQAHAAELHLYDILWRQHIWTPVRASEGWRLFASRGSATANHYDHVHVSTY